MRGRWDEKTKQQIEEASVLCHLASQNSIRSLTQLSNPDNCNLRSASGSTPLIAAAATNSVKSVCHLLALGAFPDAVDLSGATALHSAAACGCVHSARILVAAGATVDARNFAGETPLMLAASAGHLLMTESLMAAGADAKARNNRGQTVMQICREKVQACVAGSVMTWLKMDESEKSLAMQNETMAMRSSFAAIAETENLVEGRENEDSDDNSSETNGSEEAMDEADANEKYSSIL